MKYKNVRWRSPFRWCIRFGVRLDISVDSCPYCHAPVDEVFHPLMRLPAEVRPIKQATVE